MGNVSVIPSGVTVYNKDKAFNGYTLYASGLGATLIDMNGHVVKIWKDVNKSPVKPLPGGRILGSVGTAYGFGGTADYVKTLQLDWDGNIEWSFEKNELMTAADGSSFWASRQHHDFIREGTSCGYYTPCQSPKNIGAYTILLTHRKVHAPDLCPNPLLDERIIQVSADGEIAWEWNASEHFREMGFRPSELWSIAEMEKDEDWLHLNAISELGHNRHYAAGDERFAPENIICSSRNDLLIFIIEKSTGRIVWRVGPDHNVKGKYEDIGPIIGQHFVHMIPEGLPGAGNILCFDNGGMAGLGTSALMRGYSRVLEFDPVTLEKVWEYTGADVHMLEGAGLVTPPLNSRFISSAQRLPNGNTLIDQGADGIFREVTPEGETVWEFVNPIAAEDAPPGLEYLVYRAYRLPYDWVPQLPAPEEKSIIPPNRSSFTVPGSEPVVVSPGVITAVR